MFLICLLFFNYFILILSECPAGSIEYFQDKSQCVYFESKKEYFINAESVCKNLGGHLASIHNMFENMFLSQQALLKFADDNITDFWIGLNAIFLPNHWFWIDGTILDFKDWDKGYPQISSGNDCAALIMEGGTWISDNCYKEKPFVCLIPARAGGAETPTSDTVVITTTVYSSTEISTTPPAIAEMTSTIDDTESTTTISSPGLTTSILNSELTTSIPDPELTTLILLPELTTTNLNQELSSPQSTILIPNPELTTPIPNPEITTLIPNPELTTPIPNLNSTTPLANPDLTTPNPNPELTISVLNPELTTLIPYQGLTTPLLNPELTTPIPPSEVTTPIPNPAFTTLIPAAELTTPIPNPKACKNGEINKNEYCYSFFEKIYTFWEAENVCQTFGGHLASIHDIEEAVFVVGMSNFKYRNVWIGLFTDNLGKTWKWIDGTVFDFPNWNNNDHNYPSQKTCGAMFDEFDTGSLDTYDCPDSLPFICKRFATLKNSSTN